MLPFSQMLHLSHGPTPTTPLPTPPTPSTPPDPSPFVTFSICFLFSPPPSRPAHLLPAPRPSPSSLRPLFSSTRSLHSPFRHRKHVAEDSFLQHAYPCMPVFLSLFLFLPASF